MSAPSEADLRRIFERSPIGIYRSTAEGRFLYVNPALVEMLGYASADEVLALDINKDLYVDPDERAPLVARYLSEGVVDGVDVRWRRKDGSLLPVRLYGHAIEGDDAGFDVQVIDVSALRDAEAQVRSHRVETQQALTKLRSLMAQMPVMVWTVDRDLMFTSVEGTAYEPGSMIGLPLATVLASERTAIGLEAHRRALEGVSETFEGEFDDKVWLVTVAPMRDADGRVVGVIGSGVDITMMRRLEKNVQQTQRIESLGVLAGGVAHDFNNLLVAILGNADLALRERIGEPTVRQAIESIRTASLRASELTSQLLAFSGRGQLEVHPVDLGPLVAEMLGLLSPGRLGEIRLELGRDVPAVLADAAQVRQVVMNLVTNAFDAVGTDGEIRVRTRTLVLGTEPHPFDVLTAPPGSYVAIEVGDNGTGMDTSTRRKIFDPFYTTKATGHGLGLAAVLGIVRNHRGGLRLFSRPGQGSVFEVLLPAAVPVVATPAVLVTERPRQRSGKVVMVVDDEEMVREVLCHMIEDLGYSALGVPDGGAALATIDGGSMPVSAVIVDLTMPAMNGRAVFAGLRERVPDLPVILTSGYDRDRVSTDDASGFLRKPFRFETLERLLHDVIGPP